MRNLINFKIRVVVEYFSVGFCGIPITSGLTISNNTVFINTASRALKCSLS